MNSYITRREFADTPPILALQQRIISAHLNETTTIANDYLDCKEATDVVTPSGIRIGLRKRTPYYLTWRHQFTVRLSSKPNEYEKIKRGLCHWMLYGFADASDTTLTHWSLLDLRIFRQWEDFVTPEVRKKGDSHLAAYNVKDFPPALVKACSFNLMATDNN